MKPIYFLLLIAGVYTYGQKNNANNYFINTEIAIGKKIESEDGFPNTDFLTSYWISLGTYNKTKNAEWAHLLKHPKTGISFGVVDFHNSRQIGHSFSLMPFIELPVHHNKKWLLYTGLGASYFNKANNNNRAITTDITWAFKTAVNYTFLTTNAIKYKAGITFLHNSNGHTNLPNLGINSFLGSVNAELNYGSKAKKHGYYTKDSITYKKSNYPFLTYSFGIGENTFSEVYNHKKEVYTASITYGKIYNNTFRLGIGFFYRFYEHYYDYIKSNDDVVVSKYPKYKSNPFWNSSNLALFLKGELVLNHVGIDFQLGANLHKPLFKIEYLIYDGYTAIRNTDEGPKVITEFGNLDFEYELKKIVTGRIGLNYYLLNTSKKPKNNIFLGLHINTKLDQADFSELTIGITHNLN